MKRQTQTTGIKKWYGKDFTDLQSEPFKVLDGFFSAYGSYVLSGCDVTVNGSKYDVSPGLVVLQGLDPAGGTVKVVAPFAGATAVTLPVYLTLSAASITRQYNDGASKQIAIDYQAVATSIVPSAPHVEIKASGTLRFADAIQDASHRLITDVERTTWNAKESTAGSQAKANAALASAKSYTDTRETAVRSDMATKSYADSVGSGVVGGAPAILNTLYKLAAAVDNNPTFSTWVENQLAKKGEATRIVSISNFETFDPSSNLTDSVSGSTFTLAQGESCQFYAAYNANGKPSMGSGTLGATNNALASVYYWSGTITRVYGAYYALTAYGASTVTGLPQMATRTYYGSAKGDWIISTDFSSRSTSGYLKLPSGIMIEWGRGTTNSTVTFPLAFSAIYSVVHTPVSNGNKYENFYNYNVTATSFMPYLLGSDLSTYWVAIGTWK